MTPPRAIYKDHGTSINSTFRYWRLYSDANMSHYIRLSAVLTSWMICRLFDAKSSLEPKMNVCKLNTQLQTYVKIANDILLFSWSKSIWKCSLQNVGHFALTYMWVKRKRTRHTKWNTPRCHTCRVHSGYGLSQWEKALLCSALSHWLSRYPEWYQRIVNI